MVAAVKLLTLSTLLLLAAYCCYGDDNDVLMKCDGSSVQLSKDNETYVLSQAILQKSDGSIDCVYEENALPNICNLLGSNPFNIRNIEDRTLHNNSCTQLTNASNDSSNTNNGCGDNVPINNGSLIKMQLKPASGENKCLVFTGIITKIMVINPNPTNVTLNTTSIPATMTNTTKSTSYNTTTLPTNTATTTPPPLQKNTTKIPPPLPAVTTKKLISTTFTTTTKRAPPVILLTTPMTTVKDSNEWNTKKLLYIILPILFMLIVVVACLVYFFYCRKRFRKEQKTTIPLLDINSGDEITAEPLYATPNKHKKKKKKKSKKQNKTNGYNEGVVPKAAWPDYDEVGTLIEGVYEKRESLLLDETSKYGVSAMLLQDDNTTVAGPSLLVVNNEDDDDPYEKIGRCNSFTPKTVADKKKAKLMQLEEQQRINDGVDSVDGDGGRNGVEDTNGVDGRENESPYVGKSGTPLQMSSFKPGSSVRKKQQRTSVKRPATKNKDDIISASETHENVTITPQPSKKNLFALNNVPPATPARAPSPDGSHESIPTKVDPPVVNPPVVNPPVVNPPVIPPVVPVANGLMTNDDVSKKETPQKANYADVEFSNSVDDDKPTKNNIIDTKEPSQTNDVAVSHDADADKVSKTNNALTKEPPQTNYADVVVSNDAPKDKPAVPNEATKKNVDNNKEAPQTNYADVVISNDGGADVKPPVVGGNHAQPQETGNYTDVIISDD